MQKIGGAKDIAGVQLHNRRERDHSNTNPDIDHAKSAENYVLKVTKRSYNEMVNECIQKGYTGKKALRKDAVRMCEILFTSDGSFFSHLSWEQERAYFVDCYNFAAKRYGEANIISAVVHKDEATPHLHLDFVPLTSDGRLSAKDVLGGRKDLQKLQDDFYAEVGQKWSLERGSRADLDNPDEKPRKHLSVAELKEKTAFERAEKAEQQAAKKEKQLKAINEKVDKLLNYIPEKSSEDLSDRCDVIVKKFEETTKSPLPVISKSTAQDALKAMSKQAKIAIGELDKAEQTIYALGQANTDFQKANKKIESENENLRTENANLRQELSAARKRENAIQRLGLSDIISDEVQRVSEKEKARQKEKKHSRQDDL